MPKEDITIGVNVELNVSKVSAEGYLKLVEIYCNKNGKSIKSHQKNDGSIELVFVEDHTPICQIKQK